VIRALRNFLRAGRVALTELAKLTREQRRALKRARKGAHAPPPPATTAPPPAASAARRQPPDGDTPFGPILAAGQEIADEYDKLEKEMQLDLAAQQRRAEQSLTSEPARPEPIPVAPPPPPAKEYTLAAVPPSSTVRSGPQRLAAALAGAPPAAPTPQGPAAELPAAAAPTAGADLAAELDALERDAAGDVAALAARQAQEAEAARKPPAALL